MDFSGYKLLVLPDAVSLTDELTAKIQKYAENGGRIIASGTSLVRNGEFILDTGAVFKGENELKPTYIVPKYETVNGEEQSVMRCNSFVVEAVDCEVVAQKQNPYFNRTAEHYCSHMHAPNNPDSTMPGAVIKGNIAYIGWDVFTAYANYGHLCFKELFTYILSRLMGDDFTVTATVPDRAVVTYTRQENEKRSILHLLFAHTTVRGIKTEVIEDTVPLYNVKCTVKCETEPSKVYLAPSGEELDFEFVNGRVEFTVPKVDIHQMVVVQE